MTNLLLKAVMSSQNGVKMIPLLDRLDEIYGGQMTAPWRAMYETTGTKDDNDPCQIEEGLYLGSRRAANNKEVLKSLNVTHVLTVASSLPPAYPNDFKYKIVDVHDQPDVNISQYFDDCFGFVDEAKATGGGVLVHCVEGKSRSVTVVLAYLMKKCSMKLFEAFPCVKSKRPVACPNNGFLLQLQNFEKVLGGMDSNSQAQAENKKDQGCFTRTHETEQFLSARFKDQINLGTLEGTVEPKEERDLDVAPTFRVTNEQLKSNATASSASHTEETSSIISQGPANAEIIGEIFKPKQERKLEYDAVHTYRVPNLPGMSNAQGSSMSFMTNKRNYSRMEQSSHYLTDIRANIRNHWLQAETTQMAKRRNYTRMREPPSWMTEGLPSFVESEPPSSHYLTDIRANIQNHWLQAETTQMAERRNYTRMREPPSWMTEGLPSFVKSEPPQATTQMALDEVSKVEGLNDTQILRAVDLLMNEQRKFDTFSGLPNRLRRTWLQMHLGDQF